MSAPSLEEAARDIAQAEPGARRERASAVLLEAVQRSAEKLIGEPALRADIAQDAWLALYQMLRRGRIPDDLAGYLHRTVRNRHWSHLRSRRSARGTLERLPEPASTADPEHDALTHEEQERARAQAEQLWTILDRVAQHAIEQRAPAHRRHLQQAWREMKAMFRDERSQTEVLTDEGELEGGTLEAAVARLHTRHRRARLELRRALERLTSTGELMGEDARIASAALAHLVRRVSAADEAERRSAEEHSR